MKHLLLQRQLNARTWLTIVREEGGVSGENNADEEFASSVNVGFRPLTYKGGGLRPLNLTEREQA